MNDPEKVISDFKAAVNMTTHQLEEWLQKDESKKVGYKAEGKGESVGHHSGRRIIEILGKKKYDDDDLHHMAKVVGYVHRHLAQRPEGDIKETPWRYSLMNWGHDPSEEGRNRPSDGYARTSWFPAWINSYLNFGKSKYHRQPDVDCLVQSYRDDEEKRSGECSVIWAESKSAPIRLPSRWSARNRSKA